MGVRKFRSRSRAFSSPPSGLRVDGDRPGRSGASGEEARGLVAQEGLELRAGRLRPADHRGVGERGLPQPIFRRGDFYLP